ncbi:uncharacterized protein B0H18DRAFT_1010513 [Fomitopsis serialis]|uniref:uncharacterized protein n=1 Tax=Fomitopsis serialis TaxID=139415 RepID=UPI00200885DD|nr:uncharacterized protein B0H18DRAFT_1010513 [Neoantrodia serialis]KAH9924867.1 hypothetical protein B0H18DRAFT_1010513 [Neoantrodia serialis]
MYLNQNNRGRRASQPAKNGRAARPANGAAAPPPYTPYQGTNSYVQCVGHGPSERSPLNGDLPRHGYRTEPPPPPIKRPNKARAVPKWVWILFVAAFIVGIVVTVFGILQTCRANRQTHRADALDRRLAEYPPTRVELDALKAEWAEERTTHEAQYETWAHDRGVFEEEREAWRVAGKEHEMDKERWVRGRRAYDADTGRWRRAMQGYEAAKRRWAEEQEGWARQRETREREWTEEADQHRVHEGNVLGLSWGQIESHQCVRYGTREYTAHLAFDVKEACQHMPIVVNGAAVSTPHECVMEGDTLVSRWNIDQGEAACKPYWGDLYDKGCIGQGSGKHRFEARLWDLHGDMDWMVMCATTPTDIRGQRFDGPTHCENRGAFYGMVGMWDVNDSQCQ